MATHLVALQLTERKDATVERVEGQGQPWANCTRMRRLGYCSATLYFLTRYSHKSEYFKVVLINKPDYLAHTN